MAGLATLSSSPSPDADGPSRRGALGLPPLGSAYSIYAFLAMLFGCLLLASNLLATKLLQIHVLVLPAGILAYPLLFVITDIVSEAFGPSAAHRLVLAGFLVNAIMILLIQTAIALPYPDSWGQQQAFAEVLSPTFRIMAASLTAYLVSQHYDVILFHAIRSKTQGRHLWVRNTGSTSISQAIDTSIFLGLAFAGTMSFSLLVVIMASQYAAKLVIAILDTPLVYIAVRILRVRSNRETPYVPT